MKSSTNSGRRSRSSVLMLLLLVIVGGAIYYVYKRNPSLQNAFHSVKESTQDTATTSRVRTALLLSKHVSPFDIKVETSQGEVTLSGQVPSEEVKTMAGAIAQDTSGVKQVHNSLGVNPSAERNPEMERLGERVADLETKTIISDALSKNAELKDKRVEAEVRKGVVTLSGTVETTAQKYMAEQIAWQAQGVRGVTNDLSVTNAQVTPESADDKLARRVEFELYSTKAVTLKTVQIHAENGTVTLTGSVSSRAEKLLVEKITQSVEGVRKVVSNLTAPEEMQP